jgi:hypothetical protein
MQRIGDAYMVEGGLPEPRPDRDQEERPGQNAGKRFSTARRLRLHKQRWWCCLPPTKAMAVPEASSKAIISAGRQMLREFTATGTNAELNCGRARASFDL